MLVVVRAEGCDTDYDVAISDEATVGDLAAAVGIPKDTPIRIDGRPLAPTDALNGVGLSGGALVEKRDREEVSAAWLGPSPTLVVTGGPSCGLAIPLGRAEVRIGSSALADLKIDDPSLAPLHFSVRRTGADAFAVSDLGSGSGTDRATNIISAASSRFEIRTRPASCGEAVRAPAGPLVAPEQPATPAEPQPFPLLSASAPALVGLVLAWLFHPMMLFMAFMGPVMVLAGWGERRRQAARRARHDDRIWRHRLGEFRLRVLEAHAADSVAARAGHIDAAAMLEGIPPPAPIPEPTLAVAIGREERPWKPEIVGATAEHADVVAEVDDAGPITDVPAVAVLGDGDRVRISGPPGQAESLARWVVIQLAAARRSEDLGLRVRADLASSGWRWCSRLPHLTSSAECSITIGVGLDEPTVEVTYGTGAATDGVDAEVAGELARLLHRRETTHRGDPVPSPGLGLAVAFGGRRPSAASILASWRADRPFRLPTVLGMGCSGPAVVDLATAGPHGLIAGTTGSGKSEVLRTLVATTAATVSPERVNFVLIDYKGGSAFDACADLPHVVGVVTDLDEALADRALRCLEAELRRRESVLRDAGVSDVVHLPTGVLPRLCVVIDELASLLSEQQAFTEHLVGIAQRGRSLGVHLIVATQRPAGAVTPAIRANTNLRMCLRVPDPLDSEDVIAAPHAAQIPRGLPGRGWLRTGPGELVEIQGLDTSAPFESPGPVAARPWGSAITGAERGAGGPTGLQTVVAATRRAWRELGGPEPRRPWPDPLPERVTACELPRPPTGIAIGLVDDPDNQRLDALGWDPKMGHIAVAGGPRSGRTSALLAIAAGVSDADRADVMGIDAAGGDLSPMAVLGNCRSVTDASDLERVVANLTELTAICRKDPRPGREIVLVIDGLGTLLAALESHCGFGFMSALARLWSNGPSRGVPCAVSVDRPAAIPRDFAAASANTLVLPLSDPLDQLSAVGHPGDRQWVPGRGHETRGRRAIQIAFPRWA